MVNSLLILLVSLLSLGSLAAGENAHWAYRPVVDAWQPNTNEHVVIPLNTNYKTHECGGFCTFRGTNFG